MLKKFNLLNKLESFIEWIKSLFVKNEWEQVTEEDVSEPLDWISIKVIIETDGSYPFKDYILTSIRYSDLDYPVKYLKDNTWEVSIISKRIKPGFAWPIYLFKGDSRRVEYISGTLLDDVSEDFLYRIKMGSKSNSTSTNNLTVKSYSLFSEYSCKAI